MPYIKPRFFVRSVFNPIAMRFGISSTLVVKGHKTGQTRRAPISPVELDGSRYLTSPRGNTQWSRNLSAAGECELRHKGKVEQLRAHVVRAEERGPIIAAYRKHVPKNVGNMFDSIPDVADHPAFRVEPK